MTVLLGAKSHGRDIQAIWQRVNPNKCLAVYDDDPKMDMKPPKHFHGRIIYGINDPQARCKAARRHGHDAAIALVDPAAILGLNISLDGGVVIAPGVVLLRDVKIGTHSHLNYGSMATRTSIGDFVTIAPGVHIAGDVVIENRTFVGTAATICNLVHIGSDCIIAAGAIVPPHSIVPNGTTVIGVFKAA